MFVLCAECEDGDLRLVDGRSQYEGRVEVCQEGLWGFVCDDLWTEASGIVACRQAGINATGKHALVSKVNKGHDVV